MSACARSYASPATPTAAPTTSRPSASLAAFGYCSAFTKSLTVMRPLSTPASSTSGSFSILCRRSSSIASLREMPTLPVTSGIGVMTSRTWRSRSTSKAMSRLVTMPSSFPEASATGTPLIRNRPHSASASRSVASGRIVIGSVTMPGLGTLDPVDLGGLLLDGQIPVQHADAALTGHGDGHPRLGDLVHGRGQQAAR